MRALGLLLGLLMLISPARAGDLVPWTILPGESKLAFTAKDASGGPITGGFGRFSGTILFDPERLAESRISIDVDVASVTAGFPDAAADLPKPEWLSVKAFPKARYESSAIKKRPDGQYEAEGTLTLKGITRPVTLTFSLPRYEARRAIAKGSARLSRSAFAVGRSDLVADPVELSFTIAAERP